MPIIGHSDLFISILLFVFHGKEKQIMNDEKMKTDARFNLIFRDLDSVNQARINKVERNLIHLEGQDDSRCWKEGLGNHFYYSQNPSLVASLWFVFQQM